MRRIIAPPARPLEQSAPEGSALVGDLGMTNGDTHDSLDVSRFVHPHILDFRTKPLQLQAPPDGDELPAATGQIRN